MKTNAMRILESQGIQYKVKPHSQPVFTVDDAARERGVRVSQIVKAMVVKKHDGSFCLALIPGHHRLNLKKAGHAIGDRNVELANREEVTKVTGYQVGAVSPIGIHRKNTPIFFDRAILEEQFVDISSGSPNAGIELKSSDLLTVLDATLADLSE